LQLAGPDVFSDMLVGQERIVSVLGAPGVVMDKRMTWWQVGLTDYRILVVRMSSEDGTTWHTDVRWAKDRPGVVVAQYPRAGEARARLELQGFAEHVVLMEIDQPDVHPHLQAFLQAWGPVEGVPHIPIANDAPKAEEGKADQQRLMAAIAGGLLFIVFCCGCGGVMVFLRDTIVGLVSG